MIYYHIVYINEAGQSISGIIRYLYELNTDMQDGDYETYVKRYGDIKINDDYFTIIKLWPTNNIFESTCELSIGTDVDYKSNYSPEEFESIYSHEDDVTSELYQNKDDEDTEEDTVSNELF